MTSTRTTLCFFVSVALCYARQSFSLSDSLIEGLERSEADFLIPFRINSKCECGNIPTGTRLLEGTRVPSNIKYPFMAQIRVGDTGVVSGTLINTLYVLTSARAVFNSAPGDLMVYLGVTSTDVTDLPAGAVVSGVFKIKIHESFNVSNPRSPFDVALLRMAAPIIFSSTIQPICLPGYSDKEYNSTKNGVVIGWGSTSALPGFSCTMAEAPVTAISTRDCQATALGPAIVKETICVKKVGGASLIKPGDFGAPLVFFRNNKYVQMGIASFNTNTTIPDVFTYTKILVRWIYMNTRNWAYCSNPIANY